MQGGGGVARSTPPLHRPPLYFCPGGTFAPTIRIERPPMDDAKGSAMIALLPVVTDWCKIKFPHLTLVYAGEIADLSSGVFNDLSKDASALAQMNTPIRLRSNGIDVFGGRGYDSEVEVITFEETTQLLAMRRFVERWNKSEYPFNPHTTVGPRGSLVGFPPASLLFDRLYVGWGEESLTFWLKKGGY